MTERVVVVDGCSIERGRSAIDAVKRMMSSSISSGGAVAAILVLVWKFDALSGCYISNMAFAVAKIVPG